MEKSFRGEAGKAVGAVKCLCFQPKRLLPFCHGQSVFCSCSLPCSFHILGGFVQFTLAEHLGKAFLKSAKYLLVFA